MLLDLIVKYRYLYLDAIRKKIGEVVNVPTVNNFFAVPSTYFL